MTASDTKERILEAALEMLSQNGYAGTNIRELSASLGLVKSEVYKHFESKKAIWNALLDRMIAYYGERFGSAAHMPPVPDSLEDFVAMAMRMVHFTVHDERIVKTRKAITLEQYRDGRARELATKHFLTGLTEMFTGVFSGMMDKGLLRREDPAMLAFAYTAPVSALIHLCDREPEKSEDAIARAEAFTRHFISIHAAKASALYSASCAEAGGTEIRPVTEADFLDAFRLQLAPGQERFVSHPVRSLAQAYVYREQCQPFGIWAEGRMVGYVMVIYDGDVPEYDIWHMMIDASMQGRGYGSAALGLVIDYIRTKPFGGANRIALTCHKENQTAARLYARWGFVATGAEDGEEAEYVLTV